MGHGEWGIGNWELVLSAVEVQVPYSLFPIPYLDFVQKSKLTKSVSDSIREKG
jgi:hypothetical protein